MGGRIGGLATIAAILLLSPLVAPVTAREDPATTAALSGVRTQVEYRPIVPLDSADHDLTCTDCLSVPANEWLWLEVHSGSAEVAKIDVTACYTDCKSTYDATTTSDSAGRALVLLPPASPSELSLKTIVQVRGGNRLELDYAVNGELPPDPRSRTISPVNTWQEFNFSIPNAGYYFVWLKADRYPTVRDSASTEHYARAEATLFDVSGTMFGRPFSTARYYLADHDMNAIVYVGAGDTHWETSHPIAWSPAGGGPGTGVAIQGWFSPGDFFLRGTFGRAGDSTHPRVQLLTIALGSFGEALLTSSSGPFEVEGGRLDGTGVQVTAAGFGPRSGTTVARLSGGDGVMLGGVATGIEGGGRASIAYGGSVIERQLAAGEQLSLVRVGACGGEWTAKFVGADATGGSTVVLGFARDLMLSTFARSVFTVPPSCTL